MATYTSCSTFFILIVYASVRCLTDAEEVGMGINYGRLGDNLLPPKQAVQLIKKLNFKMVKIFDADADVLQALGNTGLKVSVMVPNQQIPDIAMSQDSADSWVQKNLLRFYPSTDIISVLVGNEILSDTSIISSTWSNLVPAMENIQLALEKFNVDNSIKVSTPVASDALSISYPPSTGEFRIEISNWIMRPLLAFLSRTDSFFCANIYSYFAWAANQNDITLDYALRLDSSNVIVRDGEYEYTNLLDSITDATLAAMEKLGFGDLRFTICETGWPNKGGDGATASNAAVYNNKLVDKTLKAKGSPRHPNRFIPAYIFALFNENLKPGAATERYWGITYPTGEQVYELNALNTYKDGDNVIKSWCVAKSSASLNALQNGLDYACSNGADCTWIQNQGPCFYPDTLFAHASYAFSSYFSTMKNFGGNCDFNGAAFLTRTDPSYGSCTYPGT